MIGNDASWGRFDRDGSNDMTATRWRPLAPAAISGPAGLQATGVSQPGSVRSRADPVSIDSDDRLTPPSSGLL